MNCMYEIKVRAKCPANPSDTDLYAFTIESDALIPVEQILDFVKDNAGTKEQYQEALTQMCAVALGAKVTSVGVHSGIKVTCIAP